MWKQNLLIAVGLSAVLTAEAREDYKAKMTSIATDLAKVIGAADYCDGSGQKLVDTFVAGLPHFGLSRGDIDAVTMALEAQRRQTYSDTSTAFASRGARPGQCPPDAVDKVRGAMREMENAWYRVVQNETGVDLRQTAAPAVGAVRAAPVASTSAPAGQGGGLCVRGAAVSVLYGGQWYAAKVLDGPDKMGTCLVSYDGYGSNWDEWVNANRMRPASGVASTGQAPATANAPANNTASTSQATSGQSVPAGKYSCYTFDSGQLNYAYTDVVIEAGNRYSVGNKGGSYTLSPGGAMSFTGTMSNASGKFAIKSGGKPQIDLVFNGDNRASMTCPKAR